jgi:hypothetical protein
MAQAYINKRRKKNPQDKVASTSTEIENISMETDSRLNLSKKKKNSK